MPPGHLDYLVNVVPGGPPPRVQERLAAALTTIHRYPDDAPATRAVARRHGRSPDEVLPLNGAAEAFWLLAHTLRPRRAVCVHPSFTEPEAALRAAGAEVVRAQRDPDDFSFAPDGPDGPSWSTRQQTSSSSATPTTPPATWIRPRCLPAWRDPGGCSSSTRRSWIWFPVSRESLAHRADLPGLVVVRSLTKTWALPGLRAGFLLAPPAIVAALRVTPTLEREQPCPGGTGGLRRRRPHRGRRCRGGVVLARETLAAGLRSLPGVRVWPSSANFLLIRVPDGPAARTGLSERGIAVRGAGNFPGLTPDHLRVAVRTAGDNERLVAALAQVLEVVS